MDIDSLQFSQLLLAAVIVFHVFVTRSLAKSLERIIRSLDDVENVMNELKVVPGR